MSAGARLVLSVVLLAACAGGACSRATLDAITRLPSDGGTDGEAVTNADAGDAGATGDRSDLNASGDGSDVSASDDSREVSASDDSREVSASDDSREVSARDDSRDASGSGDSSDVSATGDVGAGDDSSDVSASDSTPGVVCPSPVLKPGDTTQTVQVGGTARTYILHVPSAYDGRKPVPLLLDFHAIGGNPTLEQRGSPYPAQTDPEGVIMAFPAGLPGPLGSAWNVGPCCVADVDDVGFARKLVEQVRASACIDRMRVYAVGTSMGGGMAYYLACRAADVFAAIAPSAFDLMAEELPDCTPPRPITVVSFRGTADNVVPYGGGPSSTVPGMPVTFLGAQGTFTEWAQIDQCTGSPSPTDSSGCSSYTSCQGGVEVVLCTKQGGGQESGNAAYAWPVLKRHTSY